MFAILLLFLLVFSVVAATPWRRPHPNHLFFLELLEKYLQEEPELPGDPPTQQNLRIERLQCEAGTDNGLHER